MKSNISLVIASALVLMVMCFYNGYPLVNSDSGAYINLGFNFKLLNNDRPPFYGSFIRHTSLWATLWLPVFCQSLINAIVILRYIKLVRGEQKISSRSLLISIALITIVTPVSWVCSCLMPDIFAATLLLACLLFLFDAGSLKARILYGSAIVLSVSVHNSHLLILLLFSALVLFVALLKKLRMPLKRAWILFAISTLCFVSYSSVYYANGYGFNVSKGSHVFLMAKLSESGILKEYLLENCEQQHYKLCAFKDELPTRTWGFIWEDNGPFQKTGGWDSSREEYSRIISGVFSDPHLLTMFVTKSIISTGQQLTEIQVPDQATQLGRGSSPAKEVQLYFEDETGAYLHSRQNAGELSGAFFNRIYLLFFLISTMLVIQFHRQLFPDPLLYSIYALLVLFILTNAFVTATFANVLDRLQFRVFWVLPATNLFLISKYLGLRFTTGNKVSISDIVEA